MSNISETNLNSVPSSERLHIGFFGCRNAGKSSLVNAVTGQELAVVSDVRGTTTDPVSKAMELLPLGPVVITDTPGFDDEGGLGEMRVRKTKQTLSRTDIAVLVIDASKGPNAADRQLAGMFKERRIPFIIAYNKSDLATASAAGNAPDDRLDADGRIFVSALTGFNITELKELIGSFAPKELKTRRIAADLIAPGDTVALVCPIDESAPKGRLILPQQQTIRDILDAGSLALVTKETELARLLDSLKEPPALVITDSQAIAFVGKTVPEEVPLTTFSILMARYKGFLETAVAGIAAARGLKTGDRVLMAEGCTHHRQCNDIGAVKLPRLLNAYTGARLSYSYCSGTEFPEDLSEYSMVVHCGACMNTDRDVLDRMERAVSQGVPFTNYGITIAQATGTLERCLRPIPDIHALL